MLPSLPTFPWKAGRRANQWFCSLWAGLSSAGSYLRVHKVQNSQKKLDLPDRLGKNTVKDTTLLWKTEETRPVHHPLVQWASVCNRCETPRVDYIFLPKMIWFHNSHLWRCPLQSGSGLPWTRALLLLLSKPPQSAAGGGSGGWEGTMVAGGLRLSWKSGSLGSDF